MLVDCAANHKGLEMRLRRANQAVTTPFWMEPFRGPTLTWRSQDQNVGLLLAIPNFIK
ncbi:MAG: hypothetical protein FD139_3038 [Methylocystaceae bacterium]|nr:MAG: hypothetical protein FD172_2753 [Methylocystaceae bacterium]TXT43234.1 MAG: hypothetical protein FD139_3038 [Methylocystaceae bacterium]